MPGAATSAAATPGAATPGAPPLGDAHTFARLSLKLTPSGQRVLEGQAGRVALLGLDRWVGGTHLVPDRTWRWDPAARPLSGPA